jgi:uncharacterized pyridoxamine 5'-phosphate oxidase family protein
MNKQISITGITAAACAVLLFIALTALPGVAGDEAQSEGAQAGQNQAAEADAVTTATGKPWEHGENLDAVIEFVMNNRMGFFATVDDGKPRIRAWGMMDYADGRFYFGTANTKDVFTQLKAVPYAEWISMDPQTYTTLRISGKVVFVDDIEMKRKIIAANPMIKDLYSGEKEKEFELFYLADISTNWFSFMPMEEGQEKDTE